MSTMRLVRIIVGIMLWIVMIAGLYALVQDRKERRDVRALGHVQDWLFSRRLSIRLAFGHAVEMQVGDPVFYGSSERDLTLIGEVAELLERNEPLPRHHGFVREVRCRIAPAGHIGLDSASRATLISIPQTPAWVMKTLLPRERMAWIAREWNATLLENREEVFEAISPILQSLVIDFERIAVVDLPIALDRRRQEIGAIMQKFQGSILKEEFLPLLENELFPILFRRAKPALDEIGEEVLDQLPVWSLTWRFLIEKLPGTADDYVKREWERFVENEVIPILRAHIEDVLGALQDVVAEVSRNPGVAGAVKRSTSKLLQDRDLQHQLRLLFQDVILDNPNFHEAMWKRWQSPEMEQAFEKLAVFLGPLFKRIGEQVLGTRGGGITPEFARVLRTQILEKDRRWILIERGTSSGRPLRKDDVLKTNIARNE